jgi:oligoribonuclease
MSKRYLFLDTETTGLDPHTDALLEVAWFITDENYVRIGERQSYVVNINEGNNIAAVVAMNDYVRNMHTESGLLDELEDGATLDYIFQKLVSDIDLYVEDEDVLHIAGLSIHFDVDFLKANDFNLFEGPDARIHHRHFDLSAVKLMMEDAALSQAIIMDTNPYPHRALFDCMEALAYARRVRNYLHEVFPFQPVLAEEVVEVIETGPIVHVEPYAGNL